MSKDKTYVVTMYRWGCRERHSYVLDVFTKKHAAMKAGEQERIDRGATKYYPEVIEFEDTQHRVIVPLPTKHPFMDIQAMSLERLKEDELGDQIESLRQRLEAVEGENEKLKEELAEIGEYRNLKERNEKLRKRVKNLESRIQLESDLAAAEGALGRIGRLPATTEVRVFNPNPNIQFFRSGRDAALREAASIADQYFKNKGRE